MQDNDYDIVADDGKEIEKTWYKDNPDRLIEWVESFADRIDFEDRQELDIVLFCIDNQFVTHIGVMTRKNKFIHVYEGQSVIVSRFRRFWKSKLHSVWRVR